MKLGPIQITRRRLLQSAAAVGVVGVAGTAWVFTGSRQAYVEGLLRHHLRQTPLDPAGVTEFATDYLAKVGADELGKVDNLVKLARLTGVGGTDRILDDWRPYDYFRRRMVTNYLVGSDYFERENQDEPVFFLGINKVCGNPFARFN